jgi:hypothetical protein
MKEEAARFSVPAPADEDDESTLGEEVASAPGQPASAATQGSEFILPVEMDPKLAAAIASGAVEVEKVDVLVADNNDTITAASTSSVEQVAAPVVVTPSAGNATAAGQNETVLASVLDAIPVQGPADIEDALDLVTTIPPPTTTAFVPESLPEGTLRFDRPFFWFLHDEDMGPLYYGTIHSIATYQKEYGIESDEDLWLYDAYKTLLWNCP